MKPLSADTPPHIEKRLVEGFRHMSPAEKANRVVAMNRALCQLAEARIRKQYGPDLPKRELRLHLASLQLPRETMVKVFGWDPQHKGY